MPAIEVYAVVKGDAVEGCKTPLCFCLLRLHDGFPPVWKVAETLPLEILPTFQPDRPALLSIEMPGSYQVLTGLALYPWQVIKLFPETIKMPLEIMYDYLRDKMQA